MKHPRCCAATAPRIKQQRIDREMRVHFERDAVRFHEAVKLQHLIIALCGRFGIADQRGLIVGRLEQSAEQDRHVDRLGARSLHRIRAIPCAPDSCWGRRNRRGTQSFWSSKFLPPRPQIQLVRPGAAMLFVQSHILCGDGIGGKHSDPSPLRHRNQDEGHG